MSQKKFSENEAVIFFSFAVYSLFLSIFDSWKMKYGV